MTDLKIAIVGDDIILGMPEYEIDTSTSKHCVRKRTGGIRTETLTEVEVDIKIARLENELAELQAMKIMFAEAK